MSFEHPSFWDDIFFPAEEDNPEEEGSESSWVNDVFHRMGEQLKETAQRAQEQTQSFVEETREDMDAYQEQIEAGWDRTMNAIGDIVGAIWHFVST